LSQKGSGIAIPAIGGCSLAIAFALCSVILEKDTEKQSLNLRIYLIVEIEFET
jgi:hypothetical protein